MACHPHGYYSGSQSWATIGTLTYFFFVCLAVSTACFWTRDWTCATTVTMLDPKPHFIPFFFFFSLFLWPHLWHMEIPRLGMGSELQLPAYITATASPQIQAASATYATVCVKAPSLTHWARLRIKPASLWTLCWVLNPLSHNRNASFYFYN